jgi:rhodanese-related sulfurtransferase
MSILDTAKNLFAKPYQSVDVTRAKELLADGAVLLDVRGDEEWRAGHAPKAKHLELGQLSTRLGELPTGRTVVTICRSGMRSASAAKTLSQHGIPAATLSGGMQAWQRAGEPVVAKGGGPGRVA